LALSDHAVRSCNLCGDRADEGVRVARRTRPRGGQVGAVGALAANDRTFMRDTKNGWLANTLDWGYYAVIVLAALAAIPLYLITDGGKL
jgi:hypothetical protein